MSNEYAFYLQIIFNIVHINNLSSLLAFATERRTLYERGVAAWRRVMSQIGTANRE